MIKTFFFGLLLGLGGAAAALAYLPVVDQQREASIRTVSPNGGTNEKFHINVPADRIVIGVPGSAEPVPEGLNWPDTAELQDVQAELFKLRNERDVVIGIASRLQASDTASVIEWVLHFPARGSMYVTMADTPDEQGYRAGELLGGSSEFAEMQGQMSERWIADPQSEDGVVNAGRIELVSRLLGPAEDVPDEQSAPDSEAVAE